MATKTKSGTTKSKSSSHKASGSKSGKTSKAKKSGGGNRCWAGYEPTPGKKPGAKGSCRKKS